MRAYVTKYWETKGIMECVGECHVNNNGGRRWFTVGNSYEKDHILARFGIDVFETRAEAVAKVKKMAAARAASLEAKVILFKKIAKDGL